MSYIGRGRQVLFIKHRYRAVVLVDVSYRTRIIPTRVCNADVSVRGRCGRVLTVATWQRQQHWQATVYRIRYAIRDTQSADYDLLERPSSSEIKLERM